MSRCQHAFILQYCSSIFCLCRTQEFPPRHLCTVAWVYSLATRRVWTVRSRAHFVETSMESQWTGNNQLLHSQTVKTSVPRIHPCTTLLMAHTHTNRRTHTIDSTLSTLPFWTPLCLCGKLHLHKRLMSAATSFPPPPFFLQWKTKRTKAIVLLSNDFWISSN